ncbi:hypothetical protein [Enterovibrio sp. FF113]|uniref:hypothetical protein n=1 Tax=Enterovibrio sp. FF113 TaxID=3230010 RepID=UPI00352DF194
MKESLNPNSTQAAQHSTLSQTIEIYKRLEDDLSSFALLKPEEMTLEIICEAVSRRGTLLEQVLEPRITREMCLLAIKNDFKSLLYVPEKFIDQAFVDFTCMQLDRTGSFYEEDTYKQLYQKLPKCLLTQWHYEKLIASKGVFLKWLSSEVIDYDLCYEALVSDGMLLKYVPNHFLDKPMCYLALHDDSDARAFVPDALWDNHCERILAREAKGCHWFSY